jgi:hypothetical protein
MPSSSSLKMEVVCCLETLVFTCKSVHIYNLSFAKYRYCVKPPYRSLINNFRDGLIEYHLASQVNFSLRLAS